MGVRIMHDPEVGAALYDSTSGRAFGPIFDSVEQAESFLDSIRDEEGYADPRRMTVTEFESAHQDWATNYAQEPCGHCGHSRSMHADQVGFCIGQCDCEDYHEGSEDNA